jgi:dTDP-4-dehydrorhamnose 3,5-epimerase
MTNSGTLVELFRVGWLGGSDVVDHAFIRTMDPGAVSAWHVHQTTTDRLFCVSGRLLIALYDAREGSPTHGVVAEYRVGLERPTLITVPPGVFHGVKTLSAEPAALINLSDREYAYEEPDHWRIASDAPEIPYSFD